MPPAVTRMHAAHMSNPFVHLPPQNSIPQSSHYQSQSTQVQNSFASQTNFGSHALNGGITPFNPGSAYGGSAFSTGSGATVFNGGMLGNQGQGLASVAAQQGFARGAALQDASHNAAVAESMGLKPGAASRIREVWRHNLDHEMDILRQLVIKYPYVSMDAEFPGIVVRPIGNFAGSKAEYHYQTLRCNVDILKPIQVGITLWTPDGELPPPHFEQSALAQRNPKVRYQNDLVGVPCTWVFNLHFNLEEDMYAEASIELLKSHGMDFQKHAEHGIALEAFGSLLTTSGLAFSEDVNWLSFHSGYDFGYLLKILTNDALPADQGEFFNIVSTFFPRLWDVKFILRHAQRLKQQGRLGQEGTRIMDSLGQRSGLNDLADELGCQRIGQPHTAGSDAWLTGQVFWAMRSKVFSGDLDVELADQIYGLHGVAPPASQQYREDFFAAQGTPQQQTNGLTGAMSSLQGGAQGYTPNKPSTPTNSYAGLNNHNTPGPHGFGHGLGQGSMGAFGNFQHQSK